MADNYLMLAQGQLPTSVGSIYANSSGSSVIIRKISLSNTSGSDATAKLHYVQSAGSPSNSNVILPTRTLSSGDNTEGGAIVVEDGESIQGVSGTASAISYTIWGLQIV